MSRSTRVRERVNREDRGVADDTDGAGSSRCGSLAPPSVHKSADGDVDGPKGESVPPRLPICPRGLSCQPKDRHERASCTTGSKTEPPASGDSSGRDASGNLYQPLISSDRRTPVQTAVQK